MLRRIAARFGAAIEDLDVGARLSFATMPFALKSLTVLFEPGSLVRPCFAL